MNARTARSAAWSALLFVAFILFTVFASGKPPAPDDPIADLQKYLVDHRGIILVSTLLGLMAVPLALWFFANVRDAVAAADGTAHALGVAAVAGIVIAGACALAGSAVFASLVYVDGMAKTLGEDTIRFGYVAQTLLFASTSAGLALAAGATALAARRTNVLPSPTVWLGALAVLGNVVAMFSVLDSGVFVLGLAGIITFVLFLVVTAIGILRSPAAG
jgi:hypothetical protein